MPRYFNLFSRLKLKGSTAAIRVIAVFNEIDIDSDSKYGEKSIGNIVLLITSIVMYGNEGLK